MLRTIDTGVEEVTEALTSKEIITLIETLRLARDVKIKRLEVRRRRTFEGDPSD